MRHENPQLEKDLTKEWEVYNLPSNGIRLEIPKLDKNLNEEHEVCSLPSDGMGACEPPSLKSMLFEFISIVMGVWELN